MPGRRVGCRRGTGALARRIPNRSGSVVWTPLNPGTERPCWESRPFVARVSCPCPPGGAKAGGPRGLARAPHPGQLMLSNLRLPPARRLPIGAARWKADQTRWVRGSGLDRPSVPTGRRRPRPERILSPSFLAGRQSGDGGWPRGTRRTLLWSPSQAGVGPDAPRLRAGRQRNSRRGEFQGARSDSWPDGRQRSQSRRGKGRMAGEDSRSDSIRGSWSRALPGAAGERERRPAATSAEKNATTRQAASTGRPGVFPRARRRDGRGWGRWRRPGSSLRRSARRTPIS